MRTSEDKEELPQIAWSQGGKALCAVQRFAAIFVPSLGRDRKKNVFPNTADLEKLSNGVSLFSRDL